MNFEHVVLVGESSSLDFELPNMLTDVLAYYGITSRKGNVPRVHGHLEMQFASGLFYAFLQKEEAFDLKSSPQPEWRSKSARRGASNNRYPAIHLLYTEGLLSCYVSL